MEEEKKVDSIFPKPSKEEEIEGETSDRQK